MSYCTSEDIALWLGVTLSSDDEEVVDACIASAQGWIDEFCARTFAASEETTRYYVPSDPYYVITDDLVSIATLKTDTGDGTFGTTWDDTDYQLWPLNDPTRPFNRLEAIASLTFPAGNAYGRRRDLVQITGVFGWPSVPSAVKQACVMWSASLFKRRGSPNGSVGGEEFGPIPLDGDRDIERILAPYQGPRAFGIA